MVPVTGFFENLGDPSGGWGQVVWGWAVAAALLTVQLGLGHALLRSRWLRGLPAAGLAGTSFAAAAGAWAGTGGLMLLSLVGALTPMWLGLTLLAGLGVAFRTLPRPRLGRDWPPAWRLLAVALAAVWAAPYLLQTLLPNTDWDSAAYHLPMAQMLLERGVQSTDPWLVQYDFPGGVHVWYAACLALGAESAIVPLNALQVAITLVAVAALAERLGGARAARWAIAVGLTTNLLLELGLDARIDAFLAAAVVMAVHASVLWLDDRTRLAPLALMGMALGVALGAKYSGAVFVLALGLPCVGLALLTARPHRVMLAHLLVLAAVIVVPAGFWYARNAIALHDPCYPFLGGRVHVTDGGVVEPFQPALERLIAAMPGPPPDFLPVRAAPLPANMLNLVDVFWNYDRYEDKALHWLSPLLLLFFALPVWLRTRGAVWVFAQGLVGFLLVGNSFAVNRYLLPTFLLFAAGAGVVLARLPRRAQLLAGVLAAALLVLGHVAEWQKLTRLEVWDYLGGGSSHRELVARAGYNGVTHSARAAAAVHGLVAAGTMPRDAVLFMVGEGKPELFDVRCLPDTSTDGFRWLDELVRAGGRYDEVARRLRARGVGWLLVDLSLFVHVLCRVPLDDHSDRANGRYVRFSIYHLAQFIGGHADVAWNADGAQLVCRLR